MFWSEVHEDANPALDSIQYFWMSIDASGADPSGGSPTMYDEILDSEGPINPPRAAQLYSPLAGHLIYGTGQEQYAPFSFGGSPTLPPVSISGGGDIGSQTVNTQIGTQLPGDIAFVGTVDGDILLVNAAGVSNVAAGAIAAATAPRMCPLKTRTALSTDGTDIQWLVFDDDDFSHAGETYTYGGGGIGQVVGLGNGKALATEYTTITGIYLIDNAPENDPNPYSPSGNRIWIYKMNLATGEITSRGVKA
jgi:hypothetical protein